MNKDFVMKFVGYGNCEHSQFVDGKIKTFNDIKRRILAEFIPELVKTTRYNEAFLVDALDGWFDYELLISFIADDVEEEELLKNFVTITQDHEWWDYHGVCTADSLAGTELFVYHAYMLGLNDWEKSCSKHFDILIKGGFC